MKKETLLEHFDGVVKTARALGYSKQRVSAWPKIVPEGVAYKAQVVTAGALRVDPSVYEKKRATRRAA